MYKFGNTSKRRMKGVNPKLIEVFEEAIKVSPIDFGIPKFGGLRTEDDQNSLFKAGKSKCDGYKKKSYHQSGNALDFYAYVNGKATWRNHHLSMIAGVIISTANRMGVKVKWGGTFSSDDFSGWDMPHIELID